MKVEKWEIVNEVSDETSHWINLDGSAIRVEWQNDGNFDLLLEVEGSRLFVTEAKWGEPVTAYAVQKTDEVPNSCGYTDGTTIEEAFDAKALHVCDDPHSSAHASLYCD